MKQLLSPVFIICMVIFCIHQVIQKGSHISIPWADNYLDNFLAMPVILSLWQAEKIMLFKKAGNPALSVSEIALATIYISFITEYVFPQISDSWKADWMDLLYYFAGSSFYYFSRSRKVFFKKKRLLHKKS